jgi:hypothetical protein
MNFDWENKCCLVNRAVEAGPINDASSDLRFSHFDKIVTPKMSDDLIFHVRQIQFALWDDREMPECQGVVLSIPLTFLAPFSSFASVSKLPTDIDTDGPGLAAVLERERERDFFGIGWRHINLRRIDPWSVNRSRKVILASENFGLISHDGGLIFHDRFLPPVNAKLHDANKEQRCGQGSFDPVGSLEVEPGFHGVPFALAWFLGALALWLPAAKFAHDRCSVIFGMLAVILFLTAFSGAAFILLSSNGF